MVDEKNEVVEGGENKKKGKANRPVAKLAPRRMKFRCTFDCECLGTLPNDEDIFKAFIIEKKGSEVDKEKLEAEEASLPVDDLEKKGMTVFARDDEGNPILWDYQVKGFFKECGRTIVEFGDMKLGMYKASKWTVDRMFDNFVYIYPREIKLNLPEGKELTKCARPLRVKTLRGERVSLAQSEQVPRGTWFEITVEYLNPAFEPYIKKIMLGDDEDPIAMCQRKGIGQWRNSGKGRFTAEEIK